MNINYKTRKYKYCFFNTILNVLEENDLTNSAFQSSGQLDVILGNTKPLIDALEDETNISDCIIGIIKSRR